MSEAYLSKARFIYANVTQHKKTEFSAADAHCYLNKLWLYKKVAGLLGMKVGIHFSFWYFSPFLPNNHILRMVPCLVVVEYTLCNRVLPGRCQSVSKLP